jgi:two-component system cell cycle sensor histidine kinase/response regulator CckA
MPHAITVLPVDDDSSIRNLVKDILSVYSFRTLTAGNGDEALEISRTHDGPIDLLLTDVIMPVMDGVTLCNRIAQERPETALLLNPVTRIPLK